MSVGTISARSDSPKVIWILGIVSLSGEHETETPQITWRALSADRISFKWASLAQCFFGHIRGQQVARAATWPVATSTTCTASWKTKQVAREQQHQLAAGYLNGNAIPANRSNSSAELWLASEWRVRMEMQRVGRKGRAGNNKAHARIYKCDDTRARVVAHGSFHGRLSGQSSDSRLAGCVARLAKSVALKDDWLRPGTR